MAEQLMVLFVAVPGGSTETLQSLAARRLEVERGCDSAAYEALALEYARAGMTGAANSLLSKARHYSQVGVVPCQA